MTKRTNGEKVFAVFNTCILLGLALVFIVPIIHVVFASISDPLLLSANKGLITWPLGKPTLEGYRLVFLNNVIIKAYGNTILYVVSATAIGVMLSCFAAYALSRKKFMVKGFVTFVITFTMLFNGGLIPTYMVVRNLNMLDTRWAIILPNCVSVFNIMIMRTSFNSIPDGLEEAARIDGAGHWRVLFAIILPVSKAIIAVVVLFYAVQHWNSWFHTAIYVTNRDYYPLQIILREIVIANSTSSLDASGEPGELNLSRMLVKYAVIMVSIVPMFALYPFIQKYFVTGVMIGSIKG
ncbi:carbohydrate ABC transporter permease [Ruminococcaceae bacterium OttesenSCG-928-L11]|nr:carbohydrate ABC transporter permease [Ruminococcaceae bacterium OttesenSCG-928-L11]